MTVKYEKLWEMAHRTVKKRKKTFSASDTCTWLWIKNDVKNVLRWTATEYKQIKQEAWIWKSCIWVKTHRMNTHTQIHNNAKKKKKMQQGKKIWQFSKVELIFFLHYFTMYYSETFPTKGKWNDVWHAYRVFRTCTSQFDVCTSIRDTD